MFAQRRPPSIICIGQIGAEQPDRAPRHAAHFSTRISTRLSTCFATWPVTRFATSFATCLVTIGNNWQQYATMFLRASFARGKAVRGKGIRPSHRTRSGGQMAKLWKNVENRRRPDAEAKSRAARDDSAGRAVATRRRHARNGRPIPRRCLGFPQLMPHPRGRPPRRITSRMKLAPATRGRPIESPLVSDDELVRRCLTRDPDAVRGLMERFQSDVFGLCVRILGHRHDAEDVCQEIFLRVFRSLHRWDRERPLRPWIMGITVNRCRTWLAQRAKRPDPIAYIQDTAESPPRDESAELTRELAAAVESLRPTYRAVFVMFHEQGLPYEEIALAMDCPKGTIKTWLHRARTELLVKLRERGMVPDDPVNPASELDEKPKNPR